MLQISPYLSFHLFCQPNRNMMTKRSHGLDELFANFDITHESTFQCWIHNFICLHSLQAIKTCSFICSHTGPFLWSSNYSQCHFSQNISILKVHLGVWVDPRKGRRPEFRTQASLSSHLAGTPAPLLCAGNFSSSALIFIFRFPLFWLVLKLNILFLFNGYPWHLKSHF